MQPPPGGQPPGTPVLGQQFAPPPTFSAAGSAPVRMSHFEAHLSLLHTRCSRTLDIPPPRVIPGRATIYRLVIM